MKSGVVAPSTQNRDSVPPGGLPCSRTREDSPCFAPVSYSQKRRKDTQLRHVSQLHRVRGQASRAREGVRSQSKEVVQQQRPSPLWVNRKDVSRPE